MVGKAGVRDRELGVNIASSFLLGARTCSTGLSASGFLYTYEFDLELYTY